MKNFVACCSVFLISTIVPATAADRASTSFVETYDWSGFHVGVHGGYVWGNSRTDDMRFYDLDLEGWSAGFQGGYDHQLTNNVVVGIEADVSFADVEDDSLVVTTIGNYEMPTASSAKITAMGTIRGRVGYAFDRFLPYFTGGVGWARQEVNYFQDVGFGVTSNLNQSQTRVGWVLGGGLEFALSDKWTAKGEYIYSDFGSKTYSGTTSFGPFDPEIQTSVRTIRFGANYRF